MTASVEGNVLRILDYSTTEVAVLAEFRAGIEAGKDSDDILSSLLDLGARVASLGSHTTGAEKLEASIDSARSSIKTATADLQESIKAQVVAVSDQEGPLLKGIEDIVENFRREVDELTAGEESPLRTSMLKSLTEAQTRIREDIAAQVARQRSEIAILLDPAEPTSPLRGLVGKLDALGIAVAQVQQDMSKDVAVAEVIEAGVIGGLDYEEVAVQAIQRIAGLAGDECEATGKVTGRIARSKMGDAVVDLKVGSTIFERLVVEAKNRALTKLDWEKEAEGSKANRAAGGFIGLCKHLNDMPNRSRILVLDSQSIVVAFDPEIDDPQSLLLVYQLVKMNTLGNTGQLDEVNVAEVNKSLDDAVKLLEKFDSITKSASAIRNSADSITKEANSIRSNLSDRLQAAQNAIRRGLAPEELGPATALELEGT